MTGMQAPPLTVVQPGNGAHGDLGSIGVVFKLWGHDTGGAVSIVEHPFPVGALVPPHLHTREDEYSIVTEGQIGFRSGEREVVLGTGGYITKPRGELHAMWNAGTSPARMIEVISPAGFEHFFRAGRHDHWRTAGALRSHGPGRPVRSAVRPAGLAARSDLALSPHPAARYLILATATSTHPQPRMTLSAARGDQAALADSRGPLLTGYHARPHDGRSGLP